MRVRGLLSTFIIALCLVALAASSAAARSPLAAAARVGTTPANTQLQLVLPLVADTAGLKREALAITTPGSAEYGQYRSIASLAKQYGLPAAGQRRVVAYLTRVGATEVKVDATGLFVDATMPAGTASRVFRTPLSNYKTVRGAAFTAPASTASVPAPLSGLVTGVVGLNTRPVLFGHSLKRFSHSGAVAHTAAQTVSGYFPASGTQSGCPAGVATHSFTPNQYLTAYQFDPLHAANIKGQGERIALIEIDGFKHSDISAFAKCFGLPVPKINSFGVGLKHLLKPGGESTLDLEVLDAAAPGLKAIDVYESSASEAAALKALTSPLQNPGFKPQIISASLGLCEPFVFAAVHQNGVLNAEGALEEAAASGISFLDSSGDSGSADCIDNAGQPIARLAVNYPASSWWVTGVGGTNIVLNPNNTISQQIVWNDAGTQPGSSGGGGPSGLFTRPPYQKGTVGNCPTSKGTCREVPDVSMLADVAPGYAIFCSASGECVDSTHTNPWQSIGGTSAATPLLAGGFALIDQELRMHKRQDLGLANPMIYSAGRGSARTSVFSDVLGIGNDVGPFITPFKALGCCTASVGYDMASGWGSVNVASFANLALAAQPKIVDVSLGLPDHQHPVAAKKIRTTVSCTGACVIGALAVVQIGGGRPFDVFSDLFHLSKKGSKAISISFSKGELGKLRAGLSGHKRIVAAVVAAIVDAGGNIERKSKAKVIVIKD
jgi:subtilase family serine protease